MERPSQDVFLVYGPIAHYLADLDLAAQRREICTLTGTGGTGKSALLRYWRAHGTQVLRPVDILIVPLVGWAHSYPSATHMLYARLLDAFHTHAPPAYLPRRVFRRYDPGYSGKKSAETLRKDAVGRLVSSTVTVIVLDGTEHLDKPAVDAALGVWRYVPKRFALVLAGQRRAAPDNKQLTAWLAAVTDAQQAWKHAIELQRPTAQELRGTQEHPGLLRRLLEHHLHMVVPADEHRERVNQGLGILVQATQRHWGGIARLVELLAMFAEHQNGSAQRHITPRTLQRVIDKLRLIDPSAVQAIEQERAKQPAQRPPSQTTQPRVGGLELDAEQRAALEAVRDAHDKPAVRERATAILWFAEGRSLAEIAASYSKTKHPETIRGWINRYRAEGVAGLDSKPGQGRKPKNNTQPDDQELPK